MGDSMNGKKSKVSKIIFVTNDKEEVSKVKDIALENQYDFMTYTEDEWATFEDIEQYVQEEDISKKIVSLPLGYRSIFSLEEIEMEIIKRVINNVKGNAVKAARILKIGRATLYRKLDKYDLSLKKVRQQSSSDKEVIPYKPLRVVRKAS